MSRRAVGGLLVVVGGAGVFATVLQPTVWQFGFVVAFATLAIGGTLVADDLSERDGRSELDCRAAAISTGRCRDCTEPVRDVGPLDRWGRCSLCNVDLDEQIRRGEAAAGWDPNP